MLRIFHIARSLSPPPLIAIMTISVTVTLIVAVTVTVTETVTVTVTAFTRAQSAADHDREDRGRRRDTDALTADVTSAVTIALNIAVIGEDTAGGSMFKSFVAFKIIMKALKSGDSDDTDGWPTRIGPRR